MEPTPLLLPNGCSATGTSDRPGEPLADQRWDGTRHHRAGGLKGQDLGRSNNQKCPFWHSRSPSHRWKSRSEDAICASKGRRAAARAAHDVMGVLKGPQEMVFSTQPSLQKTQQRQIVLRPQNSSRKNPSVSFPTGHIWECIYFISCEKNSRM